MLILPGSEQPINPLAQIVGPDGKPAEPRLMVVPEAASPPPPTLSIPNVQAIADDFKRCHKIVKYWPNRRERWPKMLKLLYDRTLIYCGNAKRQEANGDFQFEALVFLTMSAASLTHGGRLCKLPENLSDDEVNTYGAAVPYVQSCCILEVLRRNKMLDSYEPHWDVLDSERDRDVVELSEAGRLKGYELYQQQIERDTKGVKFGQ